MGNFGDFYGAIRVLLHSLPFLSRQRRRRLRYRSLCTLKKTAKKTGD